MDEQCPGYFCNFVSFFVSWVESKWIRVLFLNNHVPRVCNRIINHHAFSSSIVISLTLHHQANKFATTLHGHYLHWRFWRRWAIFPAIRSNLASPIRRWCSKNDFQHALVVVTVLITTMTTKTDKAWAARWCIMIQAWWR